MVFNNTIEKLKKKEHEKAINLIFIVILYFSI